MLLFIIAGLHAHALKFTAGKTNRSAKHAAANEVIEVLFTCFRIGNAQSCLRTFKDLLRGLRQPFNPNRLAGVQRVINSRALEALLSDVLGHSFRHAQQTAKPRNHPHRYRIKRGLWNGRQRGSAKIRFFKGLAGFYLASKVAARELQK